MSEIEITFLEYEATKYCPKCKIEKTADKFFAVRGGKELYSYCKPCSAINSNKNYNTFEGFLKKLLRTSKKNAKERLNKKRISAGEHSIDLQDLKDIYQIQNGKCYYSGIELKLKIKSDWMCSIERLDNTKGYIKENVALCCIEFNSAAKWSLEKIKQIFLPMNQKYELTKLVLEAKTKSKIKYKRKFFEFKKEGNIDYIKCTGCDIFKPSECYGIDYTKRCKECQKNARSINKSKLSIRKFIQNLFNHARSHTVERSKNHDIDIDFDFLLSLILKQEGKCYYSGMNLSFFPSSDWMCSLERLDNNIGYTKTNTVLICHEFNSCYAQWTKEKFEYFYSLKRFTN